MTNTSKPLSGIKVLDFSRVLAGPFCAMLLADLGAEVIKVERPGTGDDSRSFGPFKNDSSLYFVSINRGKKSISLNLKDEAAKKIIFDFIKEVDVVVENFRPGTMEKLGFGYEDLKKVNPRLIYAAISGYGHSGPYSKRPAYDILAQAAGGVMGITGWPQVPPTRVGLSLGDLSGAMFATIGINSALYQREHTGQGQKIDVAMLDSVVSMLENALVRQQVDGVAPKPLGNRHPTITPFQAFKASDQYFVVGVGNDSLWKKFCIALEHEELVEDEKFATNKLRTQNVDLLDGILAKIIETRTAAEWLEVMNRAGIPCAPINDAGQIMEDEQVLARNMVVETTDDVVGTIKLAGNPIKMSCLPESPVRDAAPKLGEHSRDVLSRILGYSEEKIKELEEQGVI